MVQNFIDGGAAVNQLCSLANADLRVYEMALEAPTGDISEEAAMSEVDCCHAVAYGMMAVEPGLDVLSLGERKRVVDGKGVAARLDLGRRRLINKKIVKIN